MWFSNDEYKKDQHVRERQLRLEQQQQDYLDLLDNVMNTFGAPARRAPAQAPMDDPLIPVKDVAQMEKWYAKESA